MFQGMTGQDPGYPWWRIDKYGLMDYAAWTIGCGALLGAGACLGLGIALGWLAGRR